MVHKVILNKADIEAIIAHEFNVKPERVTHYIENETVGYGMDEHTEAIPKVEIILDNPQRSWEES